MPGGVKEDDQEVIKENIYTDEIIKNKSIEFYKYAMEKFAELKFVIGEALENYKIFNKSTYLTYLYAFLILFAFGIGLGLLRNNFKKPAQEKETIDNSISLSLIHI